MTRLLACAALACASAAFGQTLGQDTDIRPDGKGNRPVNPLPQFKPLPDAAAGKARPRTGNGISYHGGPVMVSTAGTNAYVIWYGNWTSTDQGILNNLFSSIAPSQYFNINTTYYNGSNVHVTNKVNKSTSTTDSYSQGTSFGDAGVTAIVSRAINNRSLPLDTNGIYFGAHVIGRK